jgi:hypothetical protein
VANLNKIYRIIAYLFAGMLLWLLRIRGLEESGFYDFDAVKNFMLASEIAQGNFKNLFYHTAPFFNLYLSFLVKLFDGFLIPHYINASLVVIALIVFTEFIRRELKWDLMKSLLFLMLSGTSIALVNFSRYLAVESLSLLVFVVLAIVYYKSIATGKTKYFYWAAFVYAVLFGLNYKAILLFPVFVLVELYQQKRILRFKEIWQAGLVFCVPFLFLILFAILAGLHPLQYFAVFFAELLGRATTHANATFFDTDILFYFKLFLYFENPLLIAAVLLFPVLLFQNRWHVRKEFSLYMYLFLIGYAILLGMSLVPKAPRGILHIYPILYFLLFLSIDEQINNRRTKIAIFVFLAFYNLFGVAKHIYAYTENNYQTFADYINKSEHTEVATTASLNIFPYLDRHVEAHLLMDNEDLSMYSRNTGKLLLEDSYHAIAGIPFDSAAGRTVMQARQNTLLAPYLILEHCEFSGRSFEEAMQARKALQEAKYHLRLIEIVE